MDHPAATHVVAPAKITCSPINKRYKCRTDRKVVGQIVQSGCEEKHMALAQLLLQQQWGGVG